MADEKKEDELPIIFEKPLRYYGADEVVGTFADQVMVSHSTGTFTLMFYQMQTAEVTDAEAIMARPDIPTKCVAKIVLPPQLVEAFYNAIGSNLESRRRWLRLSRLIRRKGAVSKYVSDSRTLSGKIRRCSRRYRSGRCRQASGIPRARRSDLAIRLFGNWGSQCYV